ncbi:MAG TPA: carboxypeptidase-like regulatory domain-containing protein, partial [Rhodothermales bacterium]|nr:carboxypeptidase-like regulatory domain-containing protein [Rhodothermales bacterium]
MRSALFLLALLFPLSALAQTQTIRGTVVDADTQTPLPGASVVVLGSDPLIGAATDLDGRFVLTAVPLGRQAVQASFVGYERGVVPDVLVGAGREVVLEITLRESIATGEEVVVRPRADRPLDEMAAVSARGFSVEETRRYAGGADDPARMASAFAGVSTTGGTQENALVIRGNAPRGVLWRLEGVEIPNPNHFAGLQVAGGGGLTLFSAQLLSDSDFFTGAFPAEYGNALSGVFDVRFRNGNTARREHAVQLGVMGVEGSSEGPFVAGSPSTYLFNYRYSTLGLLMPLLPTEAGATYQDLAFKLAFPTRRAGRFEVWGLGGLDGQRLVENTDSTAWEYELWDRTRFDLSLGVGAAGVSHHLLLGARGYLRTTAAVTGQHTAWDRERLTDSLTLVPDL